VTRVAIIGLDSAPPDLVFDRWRSEMPNLAGLMKGGLWGEIRSTHPPITVPAWTSMMASKDPGELGLYGFRNRRTFDYDDYSLANSRQIRSDLLWDVLSRANRQVILLGVPPSYPPRPVNGCVVSCFLTPSNTATYTHPADLRHEVESVAAGYVFDVDDFRTDRKEDLLARIYEKTRKDFAVARHLVTTRPWDFFMMVEIALDRIHHGFWRHHDPGHPKHEPGHPLQNVLRDYYRYLDGEIGELISALGSDTVILVVSDHGSKRIEGGICFNELLRRQGFLELLADPDGIIPFRAGLVDWRKTRAWGEGGYYGRLWLNVKGREPAGAIEAGDYERVRDELIAMVAEIRDPDGRNLGCRAHRPEDLYRQVRGLAPDLMVYFGDLSWRSVGSVGFPGTCTFENDTGPDDANHDWNGIFVLQDGGGDEVGGIAGLDLLDVAPTVLRHLDLPIPFDMRGKPIVRDEVRGRATRAGLLPERGQADMAGAASV
jgi:predicted AlkP superfamily phosphohydrolase/phosphomutase